MNLGISSDTRAANYRAAAEAHLSQGRLDEAIAAAKEALQIQPESAVTCKLIGNVLQAMGRWRESEHWYCRALQIQPDFAEVYANLGTLYARQQQWSQALASYQKAIGIKPNFPGAYRNLSRVFTQMGQPDKAAAAQEQAVRLEAVRVSPQALVNQGNSHFTQGHYDRAIACYREVLQSHPHAVAAHQNLAEALARQGKLQDAVQSFRNAIAAYTGDGIAEDVISEDVILETGDRSPKIALLGDAAAYMKQAQQLQQQENWQGALSAYQKALQLDPCLAEAYAHIGTLYARRHQWPQAIASYQKALVLLPESASELTGIYRNLGQAWMQHKQPEKAAESWYRGFSLSPNAVSATEHLNLGDLLQQQGKPDLAAVCWERAVRQDPSVYQAHDRLAAIAADRADWNAAIGHYRASLQHHPRAVDAHYGLARALVAIGAWQEALTAYRTCLQLNRDLNLDRGRVGELCSALVVAFQERADALQAQGDFEAAIPLYQVVLDIAPHFSWAYNNLADVLRQLSRWQEAVSYYQQAIALHPQFVWSHYNLGQAFAHLEQWDAAIAAYRAALDLQADLPYIQGKLAFALEKRARGDLQAAVTCYRVAIVQEPSNLDHYHRALDIAPQSADLYMQLGEELERQGRRDAAAAFYQMSLQIVPNDAATYLARGKILEKQGHEDKAIAAYDRAIALQPDYGAAHDALGQIFTRQGNLDAAVMSFQRAIALAPELGALHMRLGDVLARQGKIAEASTSYRQAIGLEKVG